MTDTIWLRFDHVHYSYPAEEGQKAVPAVTDVSFDVHEGEFVCVLGHNGSGKSTIAKLSNAILIPDQGIVTAMEIDTSQESRELEIRQNVGVVMQNPDNQIVATIVEEDVAFGPENLALPQKEIRRRVDNALKAVDLYDMRFHEPHKLSGGQKQRVAIAGILAMEPHVIVLDEPTSMLDPKGRTEVLDYIHKLNRERGIAVVLITHYMDEAVQADTVYVMEKGRIVLRGTPEAVFAREDVLDRTGLELPECAALASALRQAGVPMPKSVLSPEALAEALAQVLPREVKP